MILPHLDTDIVWPLRATQADVDLFDQQRKDYESKFPETTRESWQRYEANSTPLDTNAPSLPVLPEEEKQKPGDTP